MNTLAKNSPVQLAFAGLFIALGVLLPIPFHIAGIAGSIFLPMHIPVLLAGFYLGGLYGLCIGMITPLISHLVTGMPPLSPIPMLPIMIMELGTYGLLAGLLYNKSRGALISLIGSMIGGRLVAGLMVWLLITVFGFQQLDYPMAYLSGAVVTGLPGIGLQLFLIPLIINRLESK
ncbi:ECF transporter S component [Natranaerobius thermophilus]|uniref:ECF transporter S component n=1 Tax=Natranaerobius thermophilus (strain ATCC BAA-1301 / DSM 18059 / JW/NM-WN-LF) TaxID=457570 RepID=B2A8H1_NATTJ|nr:ECF transporter S component [Natranaerobius thermophilus]ACB85855.1 conserved hypothetical protein [Natranaerobius thermophilus JW/NM-WN-LF]